MERLVEKRQASPRHVDDIRRNLSLQKEKEETAPFWFSVFDSEAEEQ